MKRLIISGILLGAVAFADTGMSIPLDQKGEIKDLMVKKETIAFFKKATENDQKVFIKCYSRMVNNPIAFDNAYKSFKKIHDMAIDAGVARYNIVSQVEISGVQQYCQVWQK